MPGCAKRPLQPDGKLIAYFSAEYGLTECLPVYSGGLGILSGDHLKSSSDQDYPLIGLGLLYQQGYFRQILNPDGWQQERYPMNDFYTLPLGPVKDADGQDLKVTVKLPTGPVFIQVWKLDVGRITLYLLDTNIPENQLPQDRDITDSLYGGDIDTRIRQEIVLGIGGMRALKAMGLKPTVFHMNEGHSAFLALEQIRLYMRDAKLTFEEALEAARTSNVFTTHTPVPAGIDLFDPGLMYHYFSEYCDEIGIDFQQLMALGRRNVYDRDERFSMAVLALHTSSYRNAVSRLHRQVSQEMFHDLWPQLPVWEVPITSITNGVHVPSWLNGDLAKLYDQYLQPEWRDRFNDVGIWEQIKDIPDEELLEVHRRRKRRLVTFVRERQHASAVRRQASAAEVRRASEVLDPNAFTIGFARRFATYKRATLLFRDVGAPQAHPAGQGDAGPGRHSRQSASQGPAGQKLHPRGRPVLARPRFVEARRFRRRLRYEGRPRDDPGRRSLAQQSAARRRGLRHQRNEGRQQWRPQPEHSRWLVRRSLRARPAVGRSASASLILTIRTLCTPAPFITCSKTRSCRCSTSAASRPRASGFGASSNP